jgi:hypothetical protein
MSILIFGAALFGFTAGRIMMADVPVTVHLPRFAVGMN